MFTLNFYGSFWIRIRHNLQLQPEIWRFIRILFTALVVWSSLSRKTHPEWPGPASLLLPIPTWFVGYSGISWRCSNATMIIFLSNWCRLSSRFCRLSYSRSILNFSILNVFLHPIFGDPTSLSSVLSPVVWMPSMADLRATSSFVFVFSSFTFPCSLSWIESFSVRALFGFLCFFLLVFFHQIYITSAGVGL